MIDRTSDDYEGDTRKSAARVMAGRKENIWWYARTAPNPPNAPKENAAARFTFRRSTRVSASGTTHAASSSRALVARKVRRKMERCRRQAVTRGGADIEDERSSQEKLRRTAVYQRHGALGWRSRVWAEDQSRRTSW
jgi:hypothetical protein